MHLIPFTAHWTTHNLMPVVALTVGFLETLNKRKKPYIPNLQDSCVVQLKIYIYSFAVFDWVLKLYMYFITYTLDHLDIDRAPGQI